MASLSVGVIGAGANSRLHHIPKLQAIDGLSVTVVCNRSAESSARVAQEFGIPASAAIVLVPYNRKVADRVMILRRLRWLAGHG